MRVNFDELKVRGSKSVKCPKCSKRVQRQKTFSQTLNPFNKNARGEVKTAEEIKTELKETLFKWKNTPEFCAKCS